MSPTAARPHQATAVGALALVLWSTLGALTVALGPFPPLQLVGSSFAIAAAGGVTLQLLRGQSVLAGFRSPPRVWAVGVTGLVGYHALYFVALQTAPPVQSNLVNYLWPLLIVLFSAALPGARLRVLHVLGALSGLAGTALLLLGPGTASLQPGHINGYLAAAAAAVIWALYTVASRAMGTVSTSSVTGFCAVGALLSLTASGALETPVWPEPSQGILILAMGVGPAGGAFFLWDHGVKRGHLRALAGASYLVPLASTLLLLWVNGSAPHWTLWLSGALIVGGGLVASADVWWPQRRSRLDQSE